MELQCNSVVCLRVQVQCYQIITIAKIISTFCYSKNSVIDWLHYLIQKVITMFQNNAAV